MGEKEGRECGAREKRERFMRLNEGERMAPGAATNRNPGKQRRPL